MTPLVGCLLLFIVGGSAPALSLICQQMAALAVIQPELALFGSIGFLSILLIVHHFNIVDHFTIVHSVPIVNSVVAFCWWP